jgi:hypothetical protein
MIQGRRTSSLKLYSGYISQWKLFCANLKLSYINATVANGLAFLQTLLCKGLGYSALNTARSALSSIIILPNGQLFGGHSDVKLFMKGAFNANPPKPRYISTWNPTQVLTFLQNWFPASSISLEKLVMKVTMLIMLVTGQRPQILSHLNLNSMKISEDIIEFILEPLDLKQGRPGFKPQTIRLQNFPANPKICVYKYVSEYLRRTALQRKDIKALFLTTTKPYRAASGNTISRWLKSTLKEAGIDISKFTAGSSRAATTSAAKQSGIPIKQILKAGGWSRIDTFTKYYDREILPCSFGSPILSRVQDRTDFFCCLHVQDTLHIWAYSGRYLFLNKVGGICLLH